MKIKQIAIAPDPCPEFRHLINCARDALNGTLNVFATTFQGDVTGFTACCHDSSPTFMYPMPGFDSGTHTA